MLGWMKGRLPMALAGFSLLGTMVHAHQETTADASRIARAESGPALLRMQGTAAADRSFWAEAAKAGGKVLVAAAAEYNYNRKALAAAPKSEQAAEKKAEPAAKDLPQFCCTATGRYGPFSNDRTRRGEQCYVTLPWGPAFGKACD
jgi:hypothetical protein